MSSYEVYGITGRIPDPKDHAMSVGRHILTQRTLFAWALVVLAAISLVPLPGGAAVWPLVSSAEAAPAPQGAPVAPDGCRAGISRDFTGWDIFVYWIDRSNNEDGFIVEWRTSNPHDTGIQTFPANVTEWQGAPVGNSGSTNHYRVKAFNAYGESTCSNWATVTVP